MLLQLPMLLLVRSIPVPGLDRRSNARSRGTTVTPYVGFQWSITHVHVIFFDVATRARGTFNKFSIHWKGYRVRWEDCGILRTLYDHLTRMLDTQSIGEALEVCFIGLVSFEGSALPLFLARQGILLSNIIRFHGRSFVIVRAKCDHQLGAMALLKCFPELIDEILDVVTRDEQVISIIVWDLCVYYAPG